MRLIAAESSARPAVSLAHYPSAAFPPPDRCLSVALTTSEKWDEVNERWFRFPPNEARRRRGEHDAKHGPSRFTPGQSEHATSYPQIGI